MFFLDELPTDLSGFHGFEGRSISFSNMCLVAMSGVGSQRGFFPVCLEIRAILSFIIVSNACKYSVPCGLSSELRLRRSSDFGRAPTLRRRRNGGSDTRERASRSSMSATRDCALACNQHAVIGPLYVTSSIRTASAKNSNRAPGRPAGWAGERR